MSNNISKNQDELLRQLCIYRREQGVSPSFRELAKIVKVSDVKSAYRMVKNLENMGLLEMKRGKSRSLKLTNKGMEVIGFFDFPVDLSEALLHNCYESMEYNQNQKFEISGTSRQQNREEIPRLIDTQKLKELGVAGTSALQGKFAIVSQQLPELAKHGIHTLPDNTTTLTGISWAEYSIVYNSPNYSRYSYSDSTISYFIEKHNFGFGDAPCGHPAIIRIFFHQDNDNFLLCNKFEDEVDMAEFNTCVMQGKTLPPFTGDRCLGTTCKQYYQNNYLKLCL